MVVLLLLQSSSCSGNITLQMSSFTPPESQRLFYHHFTLPLSCAGKRSISYASEPHLNRLVGVAVMVSARAFQQTSQHYCSSWWASFCLRCFAKQRFAIANFSRTNASSRHIFIIVTIVRIVNVTIEQLRVGVEMLIHGPKTDPLPVVILLQV